VHARETISDDRNIQDIFDPNGKYINGIPSKLIDLPTMELI
jgi:hypothetical protein